MIHLWAGCDMGRLGALVICGGEAKVETASRWMVGRCRWFRNTETQRVPKAGWARDVRSSRRRPLSRCGMEALHFWGAEPFQDALPLEGCDF